MSGAEAADLEARIASFPYWHYEFEFDGVRTPVEHPDVVNRHRQQKRYFFEPLVELCGGSLAGRRVLDLGCNAGFWSLAAVESGCEFVLGIDGRRMHIEQAQLVFAGRDVDPRRYQFIEGDVLDVDLRSLGQFDVVLCLGLLYHVGKHVSLLERIAAVNRDLLLIDTSVVGVPGSFVHWKRERLEDPRSGIGQPLVGHPTKKIVTAWASMLGYDTRILRPRFECWRGCNDYRWGMRRAFLCARHTRLGTAGVEDRNSAISQLLDPLRYLAFKAGKRTRGGRV